MSSTLRRQLLPFQPARRALAAPPLPARLPRLRATTFPARMAAVAQLLAAGLPISCVSVSTESVFDTHESQAPPFDAGLRRGRADAATPSSATSRRAGSADRVLTLVWSEFGRRPLENASARHRPRRRRLRVRDRHPRRGHDDRRVAGPGATALTRSATCDDTADFRGLYCSLLEQWLGQEAAPIIPGAARRARVRVTR